jgi:hypothetical protein
MPNQYFMPNYMSSIDKTAEISAFQHKYLV